MVNTLKPMSPASHTLRWFVLTGLLMGFPTVMFSQTFPTPRGGEYAVSGPQNGDQTGPRAAIGGAGGFVVYQDNGIDGSGLGIAARRLDADLSPVGVPFRVNEVTAGDQEKPAVALLNGGGAAVAWQGGRQGFQNVYARFLNADGSFATRDVVLNPTASSSTTRIAMNALVFRNNRVVYRTRRFKRIVTQNQERNGGVAVATLNDGTVVVAYASGRHTHEKMQTFVPKVRFRYNRFITNSVLQFVETDTDSMQDIYFQLFTAAGQKIGAEIRANQFVDFNQHHPSVAALSDGTFVMAWNSEQQRNDNSIDVVARVFDSQGNPLTDEIFVNTSSQPCGNSAVAGHTEGGFTVAWTEKSPTRSDNLDIFARTFSPSASPITAAFRVNSYTRGDQFAPSIAATPGGQVILWTSLGQDGSRDGVYGRGLNNGAFAGAEFRVNTTTYLRQFNPHLAADKSGHFLAVWSSYQTTAGFDVFGQIYTAP